MIREELARLFTFEERHRRLLARLLLAFGLSIVMFAAGTVLIWISESGQKGGSIHGFGDAAFFCSVQLLTISSSMTNPLTPVGKVVDVGLEVWGVFRHHSSRREFRHFLYIGGLELADEGQSSKPVMAAVAVAIRSRTMYWTAVSQSGQRTAWGWLFQPRWQEGNPTRGPDRGGCPARVAVSRL